MALSAAKSTGRRRLTDRLQTATDQAIAACGENARDAVTALIVANEYLEAEVRELRVPFDRLWARQVRTGPARPQGLVRLMERSMDNVTVYKVRLYDVQNDELRTSRRLATLQGAAIMGGRIIDGTEAEIDQSQLEPGMQWTARDFNPNATVGFQRQVRS